MQMELNHLADMKPVKFSRPKCRPGCRCCAVIADYLGPAVRSIRPDCDSFTVTDAVVAARRIGLKRHELPVLP